MARVRNPVYTERPPACIFFCAAMSKESEELDQALSAGGAALGLTLRALGSRDVVRLAEALNLSAKFTSVELVGESRVRA